MVHQAVLVGMSQYVPHLDVEEGCALGDTQRLIVRYRARHTLRAAVSASSSSLEPAAGLAVGLLTSLY